MSFVEAALTLRAKTANLRQWINSPPAPPLKQCYSGHRWPGMRGKDELFRIITHVCVCV